MYDRGGIWIENGNEVTGFIYSVSCKFIGH